MILLNIMMSEKKKIEETNQKMLSIEMLINFTGLLEGFE